MEKIKKITYEQNINMNKYQKKSKNNPKRNSAIEKYSNYSGKKNTRWFKRQIRAVSNHLSKKRQ